MSRLVAALFGFKGWAAFATINLIAAPAGKPKLPKPLPQKVRDSWQKAGFASGWMDHRTFAFYSDTFDDVTGEVPFFQVTEWKAGEIKKLPQPERPFGLDVSYAETTDGVLAEIAGLKQLHSLQLAGWNVTATGLKHLKSLNNLQSLTLIGGTLTDLGTKHLADLKNLRELALVETEVTETSLGRLKNIHSLRLLVPVHEAGLKQLAELENVKELRLFISKATDAELKQLPRFKHLRKLDVSAFFTDAALRQLSDLHNLEELNLAFTQVTDVGLKYLAKLNNLRVLILSKNGEFTDAGLARLQNALPMLKITRVARREVQ